MISKEILKRIKLVVLDLDGTLLDDKGNLHNDTIDLVHELRRKGVEFSLATGRSMSASVEYARVLGINLPIICSDGASVKDIKKSIILHELYLKQSHIERALSLADKYLLNIVVCDDDYIYYTEENSIVTNIIERHGSAFKLVSSYDYYFQNILEILVVSDYKKNIKHVARKMNFPYTFGVKNSYYKLHSKDIYYLEIKRIGSNKGDGFKKLCKYIKIKPSHAAVVGDWYNDISLFETDALKVAMLNAVPEIKKLAEVITKKTNNEQGVNDFLQMLYKARS